MGAAAEEGRDGMRGLIDLIRGQMAETAAMRDAELALEARTAKVHDELRRRLGALSSHPDRRRAAPRPVSPAPPLDAGAATMRQGTAPLGAVESRLRSPPRHHEPPGGAGAVAGWRPAAAAPVGVPVNTAPHARPQSPKKQPPPLVDGSEPV
eukprot:gene16327-56034_t